jgi:hypothetical protein
VVITLLEVDIKGYPILCGQFKSNVQTRAGSFVFSLRRECVCVISCVGISLEFGSESAEVPNMHVLGGGAKLCFADLKWKHCFLCTHSVDPHVMC